MLPTVITIVIDIIVHDGFRFIIAHKNAQKKRNPKTEKIEIITISEVSKSFDAAVVETSVDSAVPVVIQAVASAVISAVVAPVVASVVKVFAVVVVIVEEVVDVVAKVDDDVIVGSGVIVPLVSVVNVTNPVVVSVARAVELSSLVSI